MSGSSNKFSTALLCEDIRSEVGGKYSLMGVFGGDVILQQFPVTIQLASYVQYELEPGHKEELELAFSVSVGDEKVAGGKLTLRPDGFQKNATFLIPRALVTFEGPSTYRLSISVDGQEFEVISKRILSGEIPSDS